MTSLHDLDGIFALATSPARAALHLFRISGADSWACLTPHLRKSSGSASKTMAPDQIEPRRPKHLLFVAPDGVVIDDVVVTFFKGPQSFTGEDSAELTSHGNPLIAAQIQSALRDTGLREALPGEFTQRAFRNGKLDLVQAEGIAAIVQAETAGGIQLARAAASGNLSHVFEPIRRDLINVRAHLEAHIDFSEDEVGHIDWPRIKDLCLTADDSLQHLEHSYTRGCKIRDGLGILLVGAPNAGKSSLYNALLRQDRALVSEEKGTTRDILRERLIIDGRDFVLLDSAGLRSTDNRIESLGIERTWDELNKADIVLVVIDLSQTELLESLLSTHGPMDPWQLLSHLSSKTDTLQAESSDAKEKEFVLVLSKADLVPKSTAQTLAHRIEKRMNHGIVVVSVQNITELEQALIRAYDRATHSSVSGGSSHALNKTLTTARQRDAVRLARTALHRALEQCEPHGLPEMVASDVIACQQVLEEITGRIAPDDIFQKIFSSFCIGK